MIRYGGVQLKGCICELKFGYNAKTGVYTNSSCSDIPKLSEIGSVWLMKKIRKMWRPPLNTKR